MVAVIKSEPIIRPMVEADLAQVLVYESQSYPFPWTKGIFKDCLRVGYQCQVIELGNTVCAYTIYSVAVGECHILNICIGQDYRRQGLARLLLNSIMRHSESLGAEHIYLEVRPSNTIAITLYESMEFRCLTRRSDYYPAHNGREDALILIRRLGPVNPI